MKHYLKLQLLSIALLFSYGYANAQIEVKVNDSKPVFLFFKSKIVNSIFMPNKGQYVFDYQDYQRFGSVRVPKGVTNQAAKLTVITKDGLAYVINLGHANEVTKHNYYIATKQASDDLPRGKETTVKTIATTTTKHEKTPKKTRTYTKTKKTKKVKSTKNKVKTADFDGTANSVDAGLAYVGSNGVGVFASYNMHADNKSYTKIGLDAAFSKINFRNKDIPYNLTYASYGYFYPLFSKNNINVHAGIGALLGYEMINNGKPKIGTQTFSFKDNFIYGGYLAIESEYQFTDELGALLKINQNFRLNSDLGNASFNVGVGVRYHF